MAKVAFIVPHAVAWADFPFDQIREGWLFHDPAGELGRFQHHADIVRVIEVVGADHRLVRGVRAAQRDAAAAVGTALAKIEHHAWMRQQPVLVAEHGEVHEQQLRLGFFGAGGDAGEGVRLPGADRERPFAREQVVQPHLRLAQRVAHDLVHGPARLGAQDELRDQMVLQVAANAGCVQPRLNAHLGQMRAIADARQHEQFGRLDRAGADHHLAPCGDGPLTLGRHRHDAGRAAIGQDDARGDGAGDDLQVGPPHGRAEVFPRRRGTAAAIGVELDRPRAVDRLAIVPVAVARQAGGDAAFDEGGRGRRHARFRHMDLAVPPASFGGRTFPMLDAAEHRLDRLVAPPRGTGLRPAIIVAR